MLSSIAPHHTMRVHFNPSSSNTQLGPIPASTTEKKSCPDSCPVKSTCYAKFHFQGSHWKKVEKTGMEWGDFLKKVRRMQRGQLWRHNVSGDLPHKDGVINGQDVFDLVGANKGRKGFTFTTTIIPMRSTSVSSNLRILLDSLLTEVSNLWAWQMLT